ncbi:MAG TPA: M48 family metallopeptidase [Gemmataceae bacterium]|nr:M48 family metallopeptidase [Gemmataceae bacterium]
MSDVNRSTLGLRAAVAGIALAFVALFIVNTFVESPTAREEAGKYFSAEEIERGLQYSKERKLLSWCGFGLQLALLTALVCTSWGRRLTDFFDRCTGRRWLLTLALVGASYLLLTELLSVPLGLARLEQARTWNMTTQTVSAWLGDWGKGLALNAVQGAIVFLGLYSLMAIFPRWWWLLAALLGTCLGVLYAFLMPELIQPLFNKFTPLEDPYLRESVKRLAKRADVPVQEILVMDASSRGRHTNAYFVGFGSTRRIVLYDTLVSSHSGVDPHSSSAVAGLLASANGGPMLATSQVLAARTQGDDELESILGHEMGHWRHHHIVKGITLAALAALAGMFLLSRVLRWATGRRPFCLTGPSDPAGLPLILLLFMLGQWLSMPMQNGISRFFERQADTAALELANKPEAFIEAEKRLARDNLSNLAPAPFNVWMFSTHPPAVERIEMARKWKEEGK